MTSHVNVRLRRRNINNMAAQPQPPRVTATQKKNDSAKLACQNIRPSRKMATCLKKIGHKYVQGARWVTCADIVINRIRSHLYSESQIHRFLRFVSPRKIHFHPNFPDLTCISSNFPWSKLFSLVQNHF